MASEYESVNNRTELQTPVEASYYNLQAQVQAGVRCAYAGWSFCTTEKKSLDLNTNEIGGLMQFIAIMGQSQIASRE